MGGIILTVHQDILPEIKWVPTKNKDPRNGAHIKRVVLHVWGGHYTSEKMEAVSYETVINQFKTPASKTSAHFVYPGSAVPNEITQMVNYEHYAWTEEAYNPTSVEIECADAIWLGHDPAGFEQLAHTVGFLLHHFGLHPIWDIHGGFCRHGDLGNAGGNHPACPTLDKARWRHFAGRVETNYKAGGYREEWGQ